MTMGLLRPAYTRELWGQLPLAQSGVPRQACPADHKGDTMRKTYSGGCHCGALRFEVDVNIGAGTVKCNCSFCAKTRAWSVKVTPGAFRLLQGADEIADYQFGAKISHHLFCRRCGIRPFERIDLAPPRLPYYNIALVCLEGVDVNELMDAPVKYEDGRNDRWDEVPADTRGL